MDFFCEVFCTLTASNC